MQSVAGVRLRHGSFGKYLVIREKLIVARLSRACSRPHLASFNGGTEPYRAGPGFLRRDELLTGFVESFYFREHSSERDRTGQQI
jgi:hypothetical protein